MNLFELFVKIGADTSEFEHAADDVGKKTTTLGEKIQKGLSTAAKVGMAAVSAAAAGVTALTKSSLDGYANYEQLVGGVETLFKNSQDIVLGYADNAYKTAGLSANEYMETVTSFSASLLQSLDGDTTAAAEKANVAITDMADNANKMGTSMESIQNAYQGFAKQNYTMLDNLKLGYGGTKEEMQRLLDDANALNAAQGNYTNYTIESYADIVDAIHTVQTEMGITGTTAKEAAATIQGSVASAKSAWANLVTGIADENADLSGLIGNFVESVATAASNIVPRVTQILSGIGEAITQIAPVISEQLPQMLSDALPPLLDAAISLVAGAANGVIAVLPDILNTALDALPQLIDAAGSVISNLASALIDAAPMLMDAGMQLIRQLAEGFSSDFSQLIQTGTETAVAFAQGLAEAIPELILLATEIIIQIADTLTNPESVGDLVDAALDIIMALTDGLLDALPQLIDAVPKIIANIVMALGTKMPDIVAAGLKIVVSLAAGVLEAIPQIVATIPKLIANLVLGIIDNLPQIILAGPKIIAALIEGLIGAIPDLVLNIPKLIKSIVDVFVEYDWGSIGKNIVDGIKNGFVNMWNSFKESISNMVNGLVSGVKNLLGIHSPSRVFAGIGENMALGLGEGFDDEFSSVRKRIESGLDFSGKSPGISITARAYQSGAGAGAALRGVNVTQNIYAQKMTPSQTLQEAIYLQKRAVMLGV